MAKKVKQKRAPKGTSSAAAQRQTQIVNVHVGGIKRARRPAKRQPKKDARDKVASDKAAPIYAFNPQPIINFPPSFVQQNQPNAWATPPPPIPQRPRSAFVEGEVAELLNQPKTEPVRLTFEGAIAERLEPRKETAGIEVPAAPPLFEPPPEFAFTEPEPIIEPEFSAEEIARNEAVLAKEARAAELAAEEDALAEAAANRKIAAEAAKTSAAIAAAERGAAAASLADVAPTSAEELALGSSGTKPAKSKKTRAKAEGPIVPFESQLPRYVYNKEGRQYFTPSGKAVTKNPKEAEPLPPLFANREPLPPLVTVRSSDSSNREPYTFLGSSPLWAESPSASEKPSGLERQRREGFTGKSGSGSVLSGAEETLLSGSAVSANWPY